MQGPEPYLNEMEIALPCAVHPDQRALIDLDHRALVNEEAYYFSSEDALAAFRAEPWKYTGKVTDPVSRERFVPESTSPTREYGGRLFFLQSAGNATRFDSDPARYGVPRPSMHAM